MIFIYIGVNVVENLDRIFAKFQSVYDYPTAMYPQELYDAYPDAKFILARLHNLHSTYLISNFHFFLRPSEILRNGRRAYWLASINYRYPPLLIPFISGHDLHYPWPACNIAVVHPSLLACEPVAQARHMGSVLWHLH